MRHKCVLEVGFIACGNLITSQIKHTELLKKRHSTSLTSPAKHIITGFIKKNLEILAKEWSRQWQMPNKSLPCRAPRTSSLSITPLEKKYYAKKY